MSIKKDPVGHIYSGKTHI